MKTDKVGIGSLVLAALTMLALGAAGLFAPGKVVGPLGITFQGPTPLNELRASYGGLHLALAIFYAWGAARQPVRRIALALMGLQFGALVASRLASMAIDGTPDPFAFRPLTLEAVLFILGVLGFWLAVPATPEPTRAS